MEKLLVVDDDPEVALSLEQTLATHGYAVESVENGADALQMLSAFRYSLILLDWNMPSLSGIDVCKRYRASGGTTPVIFLTGRDEIADKEAGLDAGGDDYLTKPFDTRELLARIRSVLRRPPNLADTELAAQGLKLDPKLRIASCGEAQVQLSKSENNILQFFLRNVDEYFTAGEVLAAVWPSDTKSGEDTVRVHMKFLREKLSRIGADKLLETVTGSGYIIRSGREGKS